jgi:WhiB family redox-sensing transcriptional regulator
LAQPCVVPENRARTRFILCGNRRSASMADRASPAQEPRPRSPHDRNEAPVCAARPDPDPAAYHLRYIPALRSTIFMDWRDRAACLDEDPELFFPIGNTGPAILQIEEAKAVCRRCEVIDTCLKWAIESGQDAGVWGGMSEDERRALKRRNARARRAG